MKIRCKRLGFGPEPKLQEPHSKMLKDSRSWRFLILKSFVKDDRTKGVLYLT